MHNLLNVSRFKFLVFVFVFIPIVSLAQDYSNIYRAFEPEIKQKRPVLPFEILKSSYAKLRGCLVHRTYRVTSFKVTPLKYSVYRLDLRVTKKKGVFSFSRVVTLFFWLGKNKIVFLSDKGKRRFKLPGCKLLLVKNGNGYVIERKKETVDFDVPIQGGEVHIFAEPSFDCE